MASPGRPRHPETLTPRQQDVLARLRRGLTNEEIAQELGISMDGVKYHVSEILRRLHVETRHEAAAWQGAVSRSRWAPVIASIVTIKKLHPGAVGYAAAAAITGLAAIGIALLVWGVTRSPGHSASPNSALTRVSTETAVRRYHNTLLRVDLDYPSEWVADPLEHSTIGDAPVAYVNPAGRDHGFFKLDAATAPTLDYLVDATAHHLLRPYGDSPVIEDVKLPAGEAKLIFPDPSSPQLTDAALIIPYPTPSSASLSAERQFFVLYASGDDIRTIASSVSLGTPGIP